MNSKDENHSQSPADKIKNFTECVACKQDIPIGASICSICKSHQRPWKNSLQFISGMAAMIVLTVSAITWLWGNARTAFWYRDDVRLLSANTLASAVVANRGDGEVFVSHLIFTMPGRTSWSSPRLLFEERIPPGQFIRREFPRTKIQGGDFVRGVEKAEFEKLIARAVTGDKCVELVFYDGSDSSFLELREMAGKTLNTFEVGGYLQYWNLKKTTPLFLPIKGSGVLRRCA